MACPSASGGWGLSFLWSLSSRMNCCCYGTGTCSEASWWGQGSSETPTFRRFWNLCSSKTCSTTPCPPAPYSSLLFPWTFLETGRSTFSLGQQRRWGKAQSASRPNASWDTMWQPSLSLPWERAWVKPASQQGCMVSGGSAGRCKAEKMTGMADTVKASTPIKLWCLCHIYLELQRYHDIRKELMSTGITEFLTQWELWSSFVLHTHHSFPTQELASMCQNPLCFAGCSFTSSKGNFHQESLASHGKTSTGAMSEETDCGSSHHKQERTMDWDFYTM